MRDVVVASSRGVRWHECRKCILAVSNMRTASTRAMWTAQVKTLNRPHIHVCIVVTAKKYVAFGETAAIEDDVRQLTDAIPPDMTFTLTVADFEASSEHSAFEHPPSSSSKPYDVVHILGGNTFSLAEAFERETESVNAFVRWLNDPSPGFCAGQSAGGICLLDASPVAAIAKAVSPSQLRDARELLFFHPNLSELYVAFTTNCQVLSDDAKRVLRSLHSTMQCRECTVELPDIDKLQGDLMAYLTHKVRSGVATITLPTPSSFVSALPNFCFVPHYDMRHDISIQNTLPLLSETYPHKECRYLLLCEEEGGMVLQTYSPSLQRRMTKYVNTLVVNVD